MGGSDAGRIDIANSSGTVVGSQYVTLTSAQSGVPAHAHSNTLTNNAVTSGSGSAHAHSNTVTNNAVTSGAGSSHGHGQTPHEHTLNFRGSIGGNRYMVGDYLGGAGSSYFIPSMSTVTASAVSGYSVGEGNNANIQNEAAHTHSVTSNVSISNVNESAHTHSVTSNVAISNVNNTAANAAESHSVMQPTMVLNYIIKA
jgi:hypothetical protein